MLCHATENTVFVSQEAKAKAKANQDEDSSKEVGSAIAIPKNPKLLGLTMTQFKLKMLRTIPAQVRMASIVTLDGGSACHQQVNHLI